jgi:hypothetical protein
MLKGMTTGLLAAGLLLAGGASAAAEPEPIDVLMIGYFNPQVNDDGFPALQSAMAAEGIRVSVFNPGRDPATLAIRYNEYPNDLLSKFHVVVFNGTPNDAALRGRLDAFSKAGGGIVWSPLSGGHGAVRWHESVGRRYDVRSLEEDIFDPGKVVVADQRFSYLTSYIWTTAISPHPVTEGVRGLFLPVFGDHRWPGTVPMRFGPSWTVLVRGMESTRTIGNAATTGSGLRDFKPEVKGSYAASPEIVGIREAVDGSGRMLVFPFHTGHTFANWNHMFMGDAMMLKGAEGQPSDGMRLFVNACRWLAAPARKAGLGGYQPPPASTARFVERTVDWSQMTPFTSRQMPSFRGVFGARTAASDGEGTVADYVAEAKRLGLDFIVFLENFEHPAFNREAYDKLVADCKAHTSTDFLALPGFLYRDTLNALYFMYDVEGERLPMPDNVTPERRVKIPSMWATGSRPPTGIAEIGKFAQTMDPWYKAHYYAIAPYTYDDGRLVDDGFDVYRSLHGRMMKFKPLPLAIVRSPGRLRHTVQNTPLTIVRADNLRTVRERIDGSTQRHGDPLYISSGPVIEHWGIVNDHGDPFGRGRQRMRVELEARSEAGIADVKIIDAMTGEAIRHFKPNGDKVFRFFIDDELKKQLHLIPVVTDVNGRFAVGATRWAWQAGNYAWAYHDGIDSAKSARGWDEQRQNLVGLGPWAGGSWNKKWLGAGGGAGNPNSPPAFRAFDGASIHGTNFDASPVMEFTDGTREPMFMAYRKENPLTSFDYAVEYGIGDVQFPEQYLRLPPDFPDRKGADAVVRHVLPTPMEHANIVVRGSAVRPRHRAPFSVKINELVVTFKQDTDLKQLRILATRRSTNWGPMYVAARDRSGTFTGVDDRGPEQEMLRRGVMDAGGYFFLGTDLGGMPAIVNIGDTPLGWLYHRTQGRLFIDGGGSGRSFRAGETLTARYLALIKSWEGDEHNNNLWLEDFIRDYAVGGGEPAYSYEISQGRLRDINYTMNLEAVEGGASVAIQKHDLPHNVLVKVDGMPANAIAGRYDLDRKQLLILPVFENQAVSSINTTLGDTRIHIGELFHCDNPNVIMSCVQAAADLLLLEVHNPGDTPQTATLSATRGFPPLAGLNRQVTVPPHSSVKLELPAAAGSLVYSMYEGD